MDFNSEWGGGGGEGWSGRELPVDDVLKRKKMLKNSGIDGFHLTSLTPWNNGIF